MAIADECLGYLTSLLRQELTVAPANSTIERLSIALGAVELALTPRDQAKTAWPADLPATVDRLAAAFDQFVDELSASPALAAAPSPAAKVKAVADAVWSKLVKGSYSKDLPHAQHVFTFAAALLPGVLPGVKRQLDCAGVVTTTYSLCQALSQRYMEQHGDLAGVRMQVSEDHCWLLTDSSGRRQSSVEVTTDTAAKRGLPVSDEAWKGWLYTGGQAVLCSPHQALAALVTSINPAVSGSGKKGVDSEELQVVQKALLEMLLAEQPAALYPAALCALADLKEVFLQDKLDAARDAGNAPEVAWLLQRTRDDAYALFERALQLAASCGSASTAADAAEGLQQAGAVSSPADGPAPQQLAAATNGCEAALPAAGGTSSNGGLPAAAAPSSSCNGIASGNGNGNSGASSSGNGNGSGGGGWQWYVYSYMAAFLARRAAFLASCADALLVPGPQQRAQQKSEAQLEAQQQQQQEEQKQEAQPHPYSLQAAATYGEALQWAGAGGRVLARYRFQPASDDQLYKDVEGVLDEAVKDSLLALAKHQPGALLADAALLQPLLQLWDGICHLYSGRAKPAAWVALLLRCCKLFAPEARAAAADAAAAVGQASSGPMQRVHSMWRELKPLEALRQQLEAADVAEGSGGGSGAGERAAKRRRGAR